MKVKHWIFVILVFVGLLFLWHNYQGHGGLTGVKSGLGVGQ
jgi:hypothetical protein